MLICLSRHDLWSIPRSVDCTNSNLQLSAPFGICCFEYSKSLKRYVTNEATVRFIEFMDLKSIVHLDPISDFDVIEIGRYDCSYDLIFVNYILFFGHHGL